MELVQKDKKDLQEKRQKLKEIRKQKMKKNYAVFRFDGVGFDGTNVIAKRCDRETAATPSARPHVSAGEPNRLCKAKRTVRSTQKNGRIAAHQRHRHGHLVDGHEW